MTGHLTEISIAKAVREAREAGALKELSDPGQRGLWLRVTKTGIKTWTLRARDYTGRFRIFVLGHHPEMGLSEAREAARQLRVEVRGGADPTAERRAARTAQRSPPAPVPSTPTDTLHAVLAIYEAQRGNDLKSWAHSRKRVDRVFAPLLPRSVQNLTAAEFQITADRFPARQSASFAVRTLRPVLRWAAKRGYCPPALAEFDQPATVRQRHRVLSREELAALWPVLGEEPEAHGACLRFILLTAARLGEASNARWGDINWQAGTWTIPREQAKSDREHIVPLSRQAIALLRRRMPADVQPAALIFASKTGAPLAGWHRAGKGFQTASGTTDWHRHDLRRTAATLMGELGTDPHIIEAALGHVTLHSGLASIYNRSRYRSQVAEALQQLADTLEGNRAGGCRYPPADRAGMSRADRTRQPKPSEPAPQLAYTGWEPARIVDPELERLIDELSRAVTQLQIENTRLGSGRKRAGRAPDMSTEAFSALVMVQLRRGIAETLLLEDLIDTYRLYEVPLHKTQAEETLALAKRRLTEQSKIRWSFDPIDARSIIRPDVEVVFVTLNEWQRLSGDSRSITYEKLGDGRLRGVKDGRRLKIDLPHGLAHLRSLPPAHICPTKKRATVTRREV